MVIFGSTLSTGNLMDSPTATIDHPVPYEHIWTTVDSFPKPMANVACGKRYAAWNQPINSTASNFSARLGAIVAVQHWDHQIPIGNEEGGKKMWVEF